MKVIEVYFRSLLLKIAMLVTKKPKEKALRALSKSDKVLFIRLNRIGDALVSTGLITAFQSATGSMVHVLADEKNAFVFKHVPGVSTIFTYRKGFAYRRELLRSLKAENYTAVIDLHDDVSATVSFLVRALRAEYKFALRKANAKFYTHTVEKPDARAAHVIERVFALSELLGITPTAEAKHITYAPSKGAEQKAREFIEKRYASPKFLLGINISAGDAARYWGDSNYRALIQTLAKYPVDIVLLSSTRDLKHAFRIWAHKEKVFYTPVFEDFAAVMNEIHMLFSPDTSTVHLASIYRKPVFGLYVQYDTDDMIWSPYGCDFDCVITKDPNLYSMSLAEVLEKFIPFLEKYL